MRTKILSINPGDIVVVNIERNLPQRELDQLARHFKELLPNNRAIVLSNVGKVELSKVVKN